jgi:hypothetical protein
MRPGKWSADYSDGKENCHDEMPKREPPTRENEPHDIAEKSERPGASILPAPFGSAILAPVPGRKTALNRVCAVQNKPSHRKE